VSVLFDHLDAYARGMRVTISLTVLSFAIAFVLGVLLASFRVSPVPPLRAVGFGYVFVIRNTPLPVHFFFAFFALPKVGITLSPFTCAVVALSGYTAAFMAETIRSGFNAVAAGQAEAARAIGLTFPQVLMIIVLPQALRSVVQPVGTLFIALTKNSSIAYTISVVEITGAADKLGSDLAEYPAALLGAAVAYLCLTLPSGWVVGLIERRVRVKR
jgi:glutamate transport system permease protein